MAGAAIFAALVVWELFFLRPGLGAPEELANLALIETVAEGWRWWLRLGGGALSRGLQALFTAGPWPWQTIYLYNALALGLLFWGLWRWAEKMGGEKAALLTLALAFSAPFSYLQARTTFAYVIQPGLLLALAWSRPTLALGALAGLLALDYEAWPLGLAALGLVWAPRGLRWAGPGILVGLALVYWLNLPYAHGWSAQRGGWAWGWGSNLLGFFFGGTQPKAMGLEAWPAFPILAWPGLILAYKARPPRWLWLWALIGLSGLIPAGPMQEPNRAIYAWPALLLLSGLGWGRILSPGGARILLVGAPLLGWLQFDRAIRIWDEPVHGLSRRLMEAARALDPYIQLRLDSRDSLVLARFSGKGSSPWVLVPPGLADGQDARWGQWKRFGRDGGPATWMLAPSEKALVHLRRAAGSPGLQPAFSALPDEQKLRRLRALALSPRHALQASLEEALRVQLALRLGDLQAEDLRFALGPANLVRDPLDQLAGAFAGKPVGEAAARARDALLLPGERWRRLVP